MAGMPAELDVRAAGFAPVKGMRHLSLPSVQLDELGPVGDRAWCLVDVGARRVLRTVQHPSLVGVVARVADGVLSMTLPSGESVAAPPDSSGEVVACDYWGRSVPLALTSGPHTELASRFLGKDVRLAAAPRGGVVFASPLTVVGTASLRDLSTRVGRVVEPARFRATLVVETDEPYVEDSWLGTEVAVGRAVIRISGPIPRCAVIDHHPETGVKDARLLKALVASRPTNAAGEPMFGVYADVVRPGVWRAT
ncbi:MAG TPA: MOSC N-terminal beta barrel domain-containing protein [Nocardioides sp.]